MIAISLKPENGTGAFVTYDVHGRRTLERVTTLDDSVQTPGSDWKYTYDALDRLTDAQAGTLSGGNITSETRQQVWDLDHAGNWTHTELSGTGVPPVVLFDWDFDHNKVNEITGWDNQSTEVAPTYDASGNMTDDKRDWKYTYDAWYRLVEVRDLSNNLKAQFRYNGLGFRIAARYDDTDPWQHFAYDERWRIVAMFEGSDSDPTEQFWYQNAGASGMGSSSYIDEVVLRDRDTDGNGSLDERLYYLQNWHHDVVALCDTSGSISERVNYDAYGSPIGTFTSIGNRKGYAGYEYDKELSSGGSGGSHTYHVRHRVYRSDLGIWTRRDPLGYVDGVSLYGYGRGRPTISYDPNGLVCLSPICSSMPPHERYWDGGEPPPTKRAPEPIIDKSCKSNPLIDCKDDPQVRAALVRYYEDCASSIRGAVKIVCNDNEDSFDCSSNTIRYRPETGCGTLAHEIIHAADACVRNDKCNLYDSNNNTPYCKWSMCTEARAAAYGSCCDPNNPWRQGMTWKECTDALRKWFIDNGDRYGCQGIGKEDRGSFWDRCIPHELTEAQACSKPIPAIPPLS